MADGNGIEYRIVSGKPEAVEKQINDLAAAGWVVDQVTSASGNGGDFVMFILTAVITIVLRRDRKTD